MGAYVLNSAAATGAAATAVNKSHSFPPIFVFAFLIARERKAGSSRKEETRQMKRRRKKRARACV